MSKKMAELHAQDLWSGKMSQGPSAPTMVTTSELSSKKRQGSSTQLPLFLDLREVGPHQDVSWVEGGVLLGEFTMPSFGELPNVVVESRLSQILEENPPHRYSLSQKACQGILNRAERRGKELPPALQTALMIQAGLK